jgi:hypothetical protein
MKMMDALRKAGIETVALITETDRSKPTGPGGQTGQGGQH